MNSPELPLVRHSVEDALRYHVFDEAVATKQESIILLWAIGPLDLIDAIHCSNVRGQFVL